MNEITPVAAPCIAESALHERAREFAERSRAESTLRAYRSDFSDFRRWCEGHGAAHLPATPETIAFYVADLADRAKPATISRRLSAISTYHRNAGFESPCRHGAVRSVLAGVRRALGTAQRQVDAIRVEDLRRMVARLGDSPIDVRDRALLLLGFASAMRRSELVALNAADLSFENEGLVVRLTRLMCAPTLSQREWQR